MCIEREKVDFKSREVNCLKECALALTLLWIFKDFYDLFIDFYNILLSLN